MISCPPSVSIQELREACDYLLIPFNATVVKCHNLSKYSGVWIISPKQLHIFFFCVTIIYYNVLKHAVASYNLV